MNYFEIGNKYFNKGDFEKAKENFVIELSIKPDDIKTMLKLCQTLFKMDDFHTSIDIAEKILLIEAKNEEALTNIGLCYHELRMFELAEKTFTRLIDKNNNNSLHFLNRANSRKYLEDDQAYKDDLAKSEFLINNNIDPVMSIDFIDRATEIDLEKFNASRGFFLNVFIKNPNNYSAYYILGNAFDKILAYKSAIDWYTIAMKYYPMGPMKELCLKERTLIIRINNIKSL